MYKIHLLKNCVALFLLFIFIKPSYALEINDYPDIKKISVELINNGLYTKDELNKLFSGIKFRQEVIEAFKKPAESLSWERYRGIFIKQKNIDQGVEFWREHQDYLDKASEKFNVPQEIIVSIIGVETRYGKIKGRHKILESLSTLSVGYERRKSFFLGELKAYLKLVKQENLDPVETLGSYAGAMGIPQFIASSYQEYAIDFDENGSRDLINSYADAIGSVANYLHRHKWRKDKPVYGDFVKINSNIDMFKQKNRKYVFTLADFKKKGLLVKNIDDTSLKARMVNLSEIDKNSPQVVFENFNVIKKYNNSEFYAMAVAELANKIKIARGI